jgi:hypothetical protein
VEKRMPVLRNNQGVWLYDEANQCPGPKIVPNEEMLQMKKRWQEKQQEKK